MRTKEIKVSKMNNLLADKRLSHRQIDIIVMAFMFLLALILRCARLFDLDIWFDEVVLLFQIEGSFVDIWNYCKLDNFPPLFPWLMKLWSVFFPGENSLRVFSALLGSLTPPVAYLLGKELLDRKVGWLLGIVCCISAPLLYYSQMIRMYALFPFFTSLSLIGFLRGLKTNDWKYWILVSVTNLLSFYTFVFTLFLTLIEFIILFWLFRNKLSRLIRPITAHIPSFILILLWVVPLFNRFNELQKSFWLDPISLADFVKLWFFLGTGSDFNNRYIVTFLLNLAFLAGFIAGMWSLKKSESLKITAAVFFGVILVVYLLSLLGQSFFYKRYFLFLLPFYLVIIIAGWTELPSTYLRKLGLVALFLSLLLTLSYYYIYYFDYHAEYFNSITNEIRPEKFDGHAISKTAKMIAEKIQEDEVIVHYSRPQLRSFTFFPSIYYQKRSLPEYIYSASEIPQYFGGQYLQEGDQIKSLSDFDLMPGGIWMVTLDSPETFSRFNTSKIFDLRMSWIREENFVGEILGAGFFQQEISKIGAVSTIHFRKSKKMVP